MPEMDDYSGPFKPDLSFEDFSKEFLLKLIHSYEYAWLHMAGAWHNAVKKRFGVDAANDCNLEAWLEIGERVVPRYGKIAKIPEINTVLDALKVQQLPLDNIIGGLFQPEYDIKSPNHVIMTFTRCKALEVFERDDPKQIEFVCHVLDPQVFQSYCINPKIKVTPLKLPPRKSQDEIACQWEVKLED
jgi:hypothetical protein